MQYTYACHQDQEISICLRLFEESLADPLEAVPAVDEDESADVLVEGEYHPHRYKTPSEGNTEDVASYDLYAPHHDDAEDDREVDVSGASEGIHTKEIQGAAILQQDFDPEDGCACCYDPLIGCKHRKDGLSEDCCDERKCH